MQCWAVMARVGDSIVTVHTVDVPEWVLWNNFRSHEKRLLRWSLYSSLSGKKKESSEELLSTLITFLSGSSVVVVVVVDGRRVRVYASSLTKHFAGMGSFNM